MEISKKIELLEEIMELEEGTLTIDSVLDDYEEWDSLSKLSLMATLKKEFEQTITVDVMKNLKTVKDVCELME